MSVVDNKTIDGVALTNDKNGIILLIADHLDWSDEYQHLMMLQRKINVYITFLEEKQYEEIYKGEEIVYGVIEIHFLYNLTVNAEKFLQSVQNQVAELGIKIQYCVSQEETDENQKLFSGPQCRAGRTLSGAGLRASHGDGPSAAGRQYALPDAFPHPALRLRAGRTLGSGCGLCGPAAPLGAVRDAPDVPHCHRHGL